MGRHTDTEGLGLLLEKGVLGGLGDLLGAVYIISTLLLLGCECEADVQGADAGFDFPFAALGCRSLSQR